MSMMTRKEYRPLTAKETEWTDSACDQIVRANCAITGLARFLAVLAEMANDESVDQYYRDELCSKGVGRIANGIEELTNIVSEQGDRIDDAISGVAMAEVQARIAHVQQAIDPLNQKCEARQCISP